LQTVYFESWCAARDEIGVTDSVGFDVASHI
jgi:hypothetical protein